jgi:aspartate aminotransferase-like enzyme
MAGLLPHVDPDGLLEYSVVYTDRALNHMSKKFQRVMGDIDSVLKAAYNAHATAVVPGSGSYGMEAVARQFAHDQHCLVIRNGWFSFRWSQILDAGRIARSTTVLKAQRQGSGPTAPFAPAAIEQVVATIAAERPALVFAPHVETASGMLLPDAYLRAVADAVHAVGGLLVLDCIASGAIWVDMQATGVDVLVSAPQKGWSGSPCAAFVMMSALARERLEQTTSSSFAIDLRKWTQIMDTYLGGAHAYHATLPTDALTRSRDAMLETQARGFEALRQEQLSLGRQVRQMVEAKGYPSVAAAGFQSPGVVVSYTNDAELSAGKLLLPLGVQSAAGVPLQCDEGADFRSFRVGLFGLDKLAHVSRTVASLAAVLPDAR